jgi:hypothetical protein
MAQGSDVSHSLYDWQVSTLMLARDAAEPLDRDDSAALAEREQAVMLELRDLAQRVVPPEYWQEGRELTPALAHDLTRAVLRRAVEIIEGR